MTTRRRFTGEFKARVALEALRGHADWKPVWRNATPKADYDVIIVGSGAGTDCGSLFPHRRAERYTVTRTVMV